MIEKEHLPGMLDDQVTISGQTFLDDFTAEGATAETGAEAEPLTLPDPDIHGAENLVEAGAPRATVETPHSPFDDEDDEIVSSQDDRFMAERTGTPEPAGTEKSASTGTEDINPGQTGPATAEEAPPVAEESAGLAVDGRAEPVPEPSGEGLSPIWLYDNIELKIWPEGGERFPVELLQGGKRLLLMATHGEPWLNTRLQDRIAAALGRALGDRARRPDFIRAKIRAAFDEIRKSVEGDTKTKEALTSRPVRLVLAKTDAVEIFPSSEPKATLFVIALGDQTLTMTASDMAARDARALNVAWMSMFYEPLNATPKDWRRVQAIWTDPELRTIHDREEITEVVSIIERLRADLEGITLVASLKELVGDNVGYYDESSNRVWVRNTRISRFIDQDLKRPLGYASVLSKHLRTAEVMPTPSKRMRAGPSSVHVGLWGFKREFAWGTETPTPPPLTVADAFEAVARREHP